MTGYPTTQIPPSGGIASLLCASKDEGVFDDADAAVGFVEAHASNGLRET